MMRGDSRTTGQFFPATPRFRPIELVGSGSAGDVFRALDETTGEEVAVKALRSFDAGRFFSLKREFRALSDIFHRNLVELYELYAVSEHPFFTMEFVAGVDFLGSVRAEMRDVDRDGFWQNRERVERFLDLTHQLVSGVEALHVAGKLHRDLKPSNIMVSSASRLVLLDFGLVSVIGARLGSGHGTGELAGTVEYMAPEQGWGGEVSTATDWYGIGVVLYEALTGTKPFRGDPASILVKKARGRPEALSSIDPSIPAELRVVIQTLMDPEPSRRPTGSILGEALERLRPQKLEKRRPAAPTPGFFVGRQAELSQLLELFDVVSAGAFELVWVSGESGIGKTDLLRRFLESERIVRNALILSGRCHPLETVSYNALDSVVDELSQYLLSQETGCLRDVIPQDWSALVRLFPVLGRISVEETTIRDHEAHELRRKAFAAFRALLGSVAKRLPLVLCIDDVQWADQDSLALLRELLAPPCPTKLLVILCARSSPSSEPAADLEKVISQHRVERIHLGPLSVQDSNQLARCLLGDGRDAFLEAAVQEAHGSPLLLARLAWSDWTLGSKASLAASAALEISQILRLSFENLQSSSRTLLEILSISGRPLDRRVISRCLSDWRNAVTLLVKSGFARSTSFRGHAAIEVYHDRIRETVVAGLEEETIRARHLSLALAHQSQADPDLDSLVHHFVGADRVAEAADWAVHGAEKASNLLAFSRAADYYAKALSLRSWNNRDGIRLRAARADALVNAGRSAEAAKEYLAAAALTHDPEAFDLRRRSAEHFMLAGKMESGVTVLRALLAELQIPSPHSDTSALLRTLGGLVYLALVRADRIGERGVRGASSEFVRIDTCLAASKGFAVVEPVLGTFYAVRHLLMALKSGDTNRIAMGLLGVGMVISRAGGGLSKWGRRFVDTGTRLAERSGSPYLQSLRGISAASIHSGRGEWREVLRHGEFALTQLQEHCRGVRWEIGIARMVTIRALEELGDSSRAATWATEWLRESQSLGDLYGEVGAHNHLAISKIARAEIDAARREAETTVLLWRSLRFSFQHFYALRASVLCDLYEGQSERAMERLVAARADLRRSRLLWDSVLRCDATSLWARVGLAEYAKKRSPSLRRIAWCAARSLLRERRSDAVGTGLLVRAGLVQLDGDTTETVRNLEEARSVFDAAGLTLQSACAALRKGEVVGRQEGHQLIDEAQTCMLARGIANPSAWVQIHVPHFG